jgi:D-amino-acid oxidase
MNITILGCGVIGLTTAVRLAEDGYPVTIRTWKVPPDTTSDKAAAFWSPYRIHEDAQTFLWIGDTYRILQEISAVPGSGVSMTRLRKYLKDAEDQSDRWWLEAVPEGAYSSVPEKELPSGYAHGWSADVPLMETPRYLPYLMDRLRRAGGKIIKSEKITDIRRCLSPDTLVVNCTGLGSRDLVGDNSVVPVRGQIVVTEASDLDGIFVDADSPIYLVPRADGCIIGGTYEWNTWEEAPDPETIQTILERAPLLIPGLETGPVLRTYAGLRPYRPSVRVERDPDIPGLLHHYGHGGAGFTLSWGSAGTLAALLESDAEG